MLCEICNDSHSNLIEEISVVASDVVKQIVQCVSGFAKTAHILLSSFPVALSSLQLARNDLNCAQTVHNRKHLKVDVVSQNTTIMSNRARVEIIQWCTL